MSATEILEKIEQLPDEERRRLFERLSQLEDVPESLRESLAEAARGELIPLDDAGWTRFSAEQLAGCYAPEDSVYDEE